MGPGRFSIEQDQGGDEEELIKLHFERTSKPDTEMCPAFFIHDGHFNSLRF